MTQTTDKSTVDNEFLKKLQTWCSHHNVSLYFLFQRAGVSRSNVTWWRYGKTPSSTVMRILELTQKEIELELQNKQKSAQ